MSHGCGLSFYVGSQSSNNLIDHNGHWSHCACICKAAVNRLCLQKKCSRRNKTHIMFAYWLSCESRL